MTVHSLFHFNFCFDLLRNLFNTACTDLISIDPTTEATSWNEFSEFTHDLGISPIPSNSVINSPKPQPLETCSYPTPQSFPSPDVGTNTLGSDLSTPADLDPFQLLDVPRPAHLDPAQSTFDYTPPPAGLGGSTLHNTPENMDAIGMGRPLAEPAVLISQATEQSLSSHMVDDPAEENQDASPSLSLEALQHIQAPEVMPIDHAQNMILLFPDLSTNKLRQAMELGDRLFPQDLAYLETQVNHWQAEGLWSFVDFGVSPGSSAIPFQWAREKRRRQRGSIAPLLRSRVNEINFEQNKSKCSVQL
jgi:hypothetical protein